MALGSVGIRLIGDREIERELLALKTTDAQKAIKKGVRAGLRIIQQDAVANAPDRSGRLRGAIKIARMRLQPRDGFRMMVWVRPGSSRKDTGGSWYGAFVEEGHKTGGRTTQTKEAATGRFQGKSNSWLPRILRLGRKRVTREQKSGFVPGQHFLKHAVDNDEQQAAQQVWDAVSNQIDRTLANKG